jgi:2-haloacid dehalogenase
VSAIRGYVFDAYGTLFDVHSVMEAGRAITTDPATLSAAWRQKQLEGRRTKQGAARRERAA